MGRRKDGDERVEPSFEKPRRGRDAELRATRDDDDFHYLPDEEPRAPRPRPKKAAGARRPAKNEPKRRSFVGRVVYWGMVASIWGVVGLGGVIAYQAAQLPPIDRLAIPKRPPNIAILGEDGTLIANRGDTGGAAVSLRELPPYLPKAFVAIEDRRFYKHFGIDPIGIGRAVYSNIAGRAIQGGSTDADRIDAEMFVETPVLDGDEGLWQIGRQLAQ